MISVLYVDDEPDLLELARIFLEQSGEFRVGTSTSAQKALDSPSIQSYDAIVSDYQMPEMDGIAFLKVVRERFGDIPFILFTGRGREEVVIEALNNGADFYIQKGGEPKAQFVELTNKIRYAVSRKRAEQELRRKSEELNASYEQITASEEELRSQYEELARSEKRIRESEERFRGIFEQIHDALVLFTEDGCIDCNRQALELYGYPSREEILGLLPADVSPPFQPDGQDSRVAAAAHIRTVFEKGIDHFEWLQQRKDGSTFLADILLSALELEGKRTILTSVRDITERRLAEQNKQNTIAFLDALIEQNPNPLWIADDKGFLVRMNPACSRLLHSTEEELAGKYNVLNDNIVEEQGFMPLVRSVFGEGKVVSFPLVYDSSRLSTLPLKETVSIVLEVTIFPIKNAAGKITNAVIIHNDITRQKQAERVVAESEEKYRTLVEFSPIAVIVHHDGKFIYVNPETVRLAKAKAAEDLIGRDVISFIHPDDRPMAQEHFRLLYEKGIAISLQEERLLTVDGEPFTVEIAAKPIQYEGLPSVLVVFRDVSERKRAEQVLAESEEKYRTLVNSSFDGIAIHQDGILVYVNPTAARLLGADDPAYFIGKPALDIVHPDDRPQIADRIRQSSEKALGLIHEHFLRSDGSIVDVDVATTPCTWQGKPASYVTFRDISEQKRGEVALRESEEKFRALVETTSDFIWEVDAQGTYTYLSPKVRDMLGYDPGELIGKTPFDLMPPDEATRVASKFTCYMEAHAPFAAIENINVHKDGTTVILETSGVPWFSQDGAFAGYRGIDRDITARKRAEDALRDSEEKFRTIVDTTSEWIWEIDLAGHHTYSNPAIESILGYRSEEIMSGNTFDLMHPEDREKIREMLPGLIREKKGWRNLVVRWRHKDSSWHYLESNAMPVFDQQDHITGFRGADRDITKRKKAEEALFNSQQMLQAVLDTIPQRVFWKDKNSVFLGCNKPNALDAGYPDPADMVGRTDYDYTSAAIADLYRADDRQIMETGRSRINYEEPQIRPDGSKAWLRTSKVPLRDKEGKVIGVLGTYEDITEQKRNEEALRQSEEKFRRVTEGAPEAIYIGAEWKFVYLNPAAVRLFGASSQEQLIGTPFMDRIHPRFHDIIRSRVHQLYDERAPVPVLEEVYLHVDGTEFDVEVSSVPFTYEGRNGAVVFVRDISDRKQAEEALRESEEKYRTLIEKAKEAVIIVQDWRFVFANSSMADLLGVPVETLVGTTFMDYVWPDDREMIRSRHSKREVGEEIPDAYDFRIIGAGGRPVWVFISAARISWQGRPATLDLLTDITERKAAEEALRKSREEYKRIFDSFVDIYYETDADGIIKVISTSVYALTGWRPEELIGKTILTLYQNPPDREVLIERLKQNPSVAGFEVLLKRRDGTPVPMSVNARIRYSASGEPDGVMGSIRDTTENVRARRALQESEEKYRRILENLQDAYFRVDRDGNLTMVSPSAARMYGYSSPDEMIGMPAVSLYSNAEQRKEVLSRINEQGKITDVTGSALRKDKTTFWVSINVQNIFDDTGAIAGTEAIVRDVTERQSMEQAIQEANRKLNLLNSITRHDVVNQLTVLQGYAQLAAIQNPDPVTADFLDKIGATAEIITRQIEFTREYQELGIQSPAWFRLDETVAKAGRPEVTFSNTCRAVEVFADPMLERVFFNLFENAIRHGGHVTGIAVRCERAPDGLVIIVEDDGVGISPEEKEKIFEKGFGKNTGFGLFLAREILAITDITIRETGYVGVGARFEITVPKKMWRIPEEQ